MLRGRGLGQTDPIDDVAADACLPFMQHRHDFKPGGMPERLGEHREFIDTPLPRQRRRGLLNADVCHPWFYSSLFDDER